MGYDSSFRLRVYTKTRKEAEKIISEIEEASGYGGYGYAGFADKSLNKDANGYLGEVSLYEVHWYYADEDCQGVAENHPEAVIELYREGEERDDTVICCYKGGQREAYKFETSFAPFQKILLPGETQEPRKKLYAAALVEVDDEGIQSFCSLHSGTDPEKVTESVVAALQAEDRKRNLDIDIQRGDILKAVSEGNENTGDQLHIDVEDEDIFFILITKVTEP